MGIKSWQTNFIFTITVLEIIDEKTENDIDEVEETFKFKIAWYDFDFLKIKINYLHFASST